jgi:hypothetical protein
MVPIRSGPRIVGLHSAGGSSHVHEGPLRDHGQWPCFTLGPNIFDYKEIFFLFYVAKSISFK